MLNNINWEVRDRRFDTEVLIFVRLPQMGSLETVLSFVE